MPAPTDLRRSNAPVAVAFALGLLAHAAHHQSRPAVGIMTLLPVVQAAYGLALGLLVGLDVSA